MDNLMIAVIVMLVFVFISRTINEKANKKLDQNKKAELIDLFSKDRTYTFGALILIIALFFISLRYNLVEPFISFVAYIALIFMFLIITGIRAYKILKTNDFPASYIKSYILTTSLRFIGLLVFFAIMEY